MPQRTYPSSIWGELVADAHTVSRELIKLLDKRQVWRAHNKSLEGDGVEGPTALVHHWLHENYLDSIIIGLRRAIDRDPDALSLVKLLEAVASRHYEFTFRRFVTLYDGYGDELAKLDFAHYSIDGLVIDREMVHRDIIRLRRDHDSLLQWANTRVAHFKPNRQPQEPARTLTFGDLDSALDDVVEVMNKYLVLLTACQSCNETIIPVGYEHAFDAMIVASKGDGTAEEESPGSDQRSSAEP